MPKRKRGEPKLEDRLADWEKELARSLKAAKGFERQRLSKRIRESEGHKLERLEREVKALKDLDLHQAARAHLCSSLLKIKGVAEAPNLPQIIRPPPKLDVDEDVRVALHNVTSALFNRKQVKDVVDEAIMGVCITLRVPMPEKRAKGKGKSAKPGREGPEDQADDRQTKESGEAPVWTKGLTSTVAEDEAEAEKRDSDGMHFGDEESEWAGFEDEVSPADMDSDEEERAFSRFDDLLGGSGEDEEDNDDLDNGDKQDSRALSIRSKSDYFSGSSGEEDTDVETDEPDSGEEESEGDEIEEETRENVEAEEEKDIAPAEPQPKPAKQSTRPAPAPTGNSNFLPSLMGGYISGSESEASEIDVAPPAKKNRRGQRARQAIWEQKFKDKAKHVAQQKSGRDQGWDMRRGAVGPDDGAAGPWKKGVRTTSSTSRRPPRAAPAADSSGSNAVKLGPNKRVSAPATVPSKSQPDNAGPLHPSWEAAKKAKEQKVEFKGKKIVFD